MQPLFNDHLAASALVFLIVIHAMNLGYAFLPWSELLDFTDCIVTQNNSCCAVAQFS